MQNPQSNSLQEPNFLESLYLLIGASWNVTRLQGDSRCESGISLFCKRWSWLDSILPNMRTQGRVQDNELGDRSPRFDSIAGWSAMAVLVGDIQKAGRGSVDGGGWCFFDSFFFNLSCFSLQLRPFSPRISGRATLCSTPSPQGTPTSSSLVTEPKTGDGNTSCSQVTLWSSLSS